MSEPRVLAKFTSYGAMLDALRARLDELSITHGTFDRIAGVADGYTNKVLKPVPVRHLLPTTLEFFINGAAVELWLVERPGETARLRARSDFEPPRWPKKRVDMHRDGASPAQVKRLKPLIEPLVLSESGKRARQIGIAMLTPQQRSEIARHAAFCRWRPRHKHTA
jgi:hypothetical protein